MAESKGKWYDTKSGKVVTSEPEEGVQLVAPGTEETPEAQQLVKLYEEGGGEPATLTTESVSSKKK